jgi:transposase
VQQHARRAFLPVLWRDLIACDWAMYRWRHLIENCFAKLKEFRAVATRYDKTDTSYAATINLAAAIIASR